MRGTQRYSTLPDNADKILFAEDFVNHILLKLKLPLLSSGIANHRALIHNAFNNEIRLGANYCYRCLEDEISIEYNDILKKNTLMDGNAFLKYVIHMRFGYGLLRNEFEPRWLMRFLVKISAMAGKFYLHGFLDAPVVAVDNIISVLIDIDMDEEGWKDLNIVSAGFAQYFIDMDNYLTPESASDYEWESDSLSTLSSQDSEKSRSPDQEIEGREVQDEHPDELADDDDRNLCVADLLSLSEEPVPSSSNSKHAEETDDIKADSIASSYESTSESMSSGSSQEKNSDTSFHSIELTSSEDDSSKQKIRHWQYKKPSCSHSKESESDVDLCETDLETADNQLTEKRSDIFISPVNELHKSDSAHHFKTSDSDNLTEAMKASLLEDGDRVKSSRKSSSPVQKPVPKRRK